MRYRESEWRGYLIILLIIATMVTTIISFITASSIREAWTGILTNIIVTVLVLLIEKIDDYTKHKRHINEEIDKLYFEYDIFYRRLQSIVDTINKKGAELNSIRASNEFSNYYERQEIVKDIFKDINELYALVNRYSLKLMEYKEKIVPYIRNKEDRESCDMYIEYLIRNCKTLNRVYFRTLNRTESELDYILQDNLVNKFIKTIHAIHMVPDRINTHINHYFCDVISKITSNKSDVRKEEKFWIHYIKKHYNSKEDIKKRIVSEKKMRTKDMKNLLLDKEYYKSYINETCRDGKIELI